MTTDREALRALAEAALSPRDGDYEYERLDTREGHALAAALDPQTVLAILDERDALRAALGEIAGYRRPWHAAETDPDAIAACARCQGYRDHPIQRGICDEHRRPFWKAEADNDAEVRRTEGVLKGIAREALRARGSGR